MPTPAKGYFTRDGRRVPSVTTIIGRFKDSDRLMFWAFRQGKEGKATLYEETQKAANIGSTVHKMVENFFDGFDVYANTGFDDLTAEDQEKAASAVRAFERWQDNFGLKVIAQETQLVSEMHRYGGTPDMIAMVGNQICLIDWKTSGGVYESMLVQLAAYRELWNENHPEQQIAGPFHLLRFAKEHGDFTHKSFEDLSDGWEQFQLFRRAYEIDKSLKKRAA